MVQKMMSTVNGDLGVGNMGTLREYFDTDSSGALCSHRERTLSTPEKQTIPVTEKLHLDFTANAKYISYYIGPVGDASDVCRFLVDHPEFALSLLDCAAIGSGFFGGPLKPATELHFTHQFTFYIDQDIPACVRKTIHDYGRSRGLWVDIRDREYQERRSEQEHPLAFICHDSRDKDRIARSLAVGLRARMVSVWYDEFSLKVGDKLRESVEKGLKECRRCILILTPNFLSNEGWTKREFDSVFTRELLDSSDIILPVWDKVDKRQVYEYSPSLANVVAAKWEEGEDEVIGKIARILSRA